ncbi:DUF29 domain-containing protein [Sphaerospermopsis kisseleviana CS-549]|uniref:DUF29 domain-containing protein n=1 Tax=Sphaerospermopsis kisseleviana CS-549 TaxID=3021783 RepID=A0ABT4ZW74_9CYAN|nr:DUF29 domain-containing protein [Sphaerospermopsis kisseleviana]MDB9443675.1 DUF29 domain-containing protein [Sphaerospermopsis kisseleviana CS-549]BAZ79512.1 hypothetical protein NIES73_07560 [Sphaerospermopsis kisseleviana NIES-73]
MEKLKIEIDSKKLYEQDFYLWLQTTANLLENNKFDELDIRNLIEEINSMGRSEKKELKSRLITLIEHILKLEYWQLEKENNARGWRNTVAEQRLQIELTLEDSPSLRNMLDDIFEECYQKARQYILKRYQLSPNLFPENPPFSVTDVLNADYLP